jgi:CRP-like cAMP-binding protein
VDQAFQLFSELVLFRHIERREIAALFTRVRIRDFAPNETIFLKGSPADSMMFVLRGTVEISVPPKGQILIGTDVPISGSRSFDWLHRLSPGETFGEFALLEGRARLADAIAITDCTLAIVDRHNMLAFLEQNPGAWQDIVALFRARFERLRDRPQYVDPQQADLMEVALLLEERARILGAKVRAQGSTEHRDAEIGGRRLTAILAADIAGYSALMGENETETVGTLKGHQGVILLMIAGFGGRVIDTAGDGVLAEFFSVLKAVKCAVAIQETMLERNASVAPDRQMQFRIG